MNSSPNSDLKDSSGIIKPLFIFENKHLIIIDESIIQKLGIKDNPTFVEQELTDDGILMRIKKFSFLEREDSK